MLIKTLEPYWILPSPTRSPSQLAQISAGNAAVKHEGVSVSDCRPLPPGVDSRDPGGNMMIFFCCFPLSTLVAAFMCNCSFADETGLSLGGSQNAEASGEVKVGGEDKVTNNNLNLLK